MPSVDEVFELADAISQLGPLMTNGHHAGDRFRSLILCAGTLGPRPGELVAHQTGLDRLGRDSLHALRSSPLAASTTPRRASRGLQTQLPQAPRGG